MRRKRTAEFGILAAVAWLFASPASAARVTLFDEEAPADRTWPPFTQYVTRGAWSGKVCLERHVFTNQRVDLGVARIGARFDTNRLDWDTARLEFWIDPGTQVLKDCGVQIVVRTRGRGRGGQTFATNVGDIGDGVPGYRRIVVPMKMFAPSQDALLGEGGSIDQWTFLAEAKKGTRFRIDDVRIVDDAYYLPPPEPEPAPVRLSSGPVIKNGRIEFAVSDFCDVAVHVLDSGGKVVRHLAAGVLGTNAPHPLQSGSKSQSIPFDGKADDGKPLSAGDYTIRVGARMTVALDRLLGEDPDGYTFGFPTGIQTDERGFVYVLQHCGPQRDNDHRVWVYDRDGRYVREMLSPNPNLVPEYWNVRAPSKQADVTSGYNRYDLHPLVYLGSGHFCAFSIDHGVEGAYPGVRKPVRFRSDGGGFREVASHVYWMSLHSEYWYACPIDEETLLVSDGSIRDQADSTNAFRPSFFTGKTWEWRVGRLQHVVYSARLTDTALEPNRAFVFAGRRFLSEPRDHLGTICETGDTATNFDGPRGVARNRQGDIYVCDSGNDKIKVYRSDGWFLREHAKVGGLFGRKLSKPSVITIEPQSGAIYLIDGGGASPNGGKRLSKLEARGNGLREVWSVALDELAGYQIAVDTSAKPILVWTLFGDGFASFTRIEDLGDRAGKVTHFGGPKRWKGMLQCSNLEVDEEGNCYAGRYHHQQRIAFFYRLSPEGALSAKTFPLEYPVNEWVSHPLAFGPDARLYALGRDGIVRIGFNGGEVDPRGCERISLDTNVEGRLIHRQGFSIDDEGNFYTLALVKGDTNTDEASRYLNLDRRLEKFSPEGKRIEKSCVTNLPGRLRFLRVRRGAGYWVSSGAQLFYFDWTGARRWERGGFRFAMHDYCDCARPGFDVDENLYTWAGDMGSCSVFVFDVAGNPVMRFGSYGNRDCRGPGSEYPLPAIPIYNPRMVRVGDDFVWVDDWNNQRIVRCRIGWEATAAAPWKAP